MTPEQMAEALFFVVSAGIPEDRAWEIVARIDEAIEDDD